MAPERVRSDQRPTASERAASRRRQVRKGTRSCWECRRRKIRCVFDEPGPRDTCRPCWTKGTPCVSQEFPEDHASAPVGAVGDRLRRMERLVEHLYSKTNEGESLATGHAEEDKAEPLACETGPGMTAASSIVVAVDCRSVEADQCPPVREQPVPEDPGATGHAAPESHHLPHGSSAALRLLSNTHAAISRQLADALPSEEDCQVIRRLYSDADLMFQLMFTPHGILETVQSEPMDQFIDSLYQPMHPVLLAKRMLILVTMLQRIPATHARDPSATWSSPRLLMERLADAAISLVCESNKLMGTIDTLQCLVLQTVYLANGGNLRLSMLACRRAMSVGQLMGIHRPHDPSAVATLDPRTEVNSRFVWFRIVYLERFICLLLGLPDSVRGPVSNPEGSWRPPLEDHPLDKLEQVHCCVASKIIQRNEQDSLAVLLEITRTLDLELQTAAASMPPRWWTIPKFNGQTKAPLGIVAESTRLCSQLFHYFLLIELHLPFMLRHSRDGAASSSRMACIDASREVLARFVTIRSAKGVCSVPDAADFFALIAAMTLLLAHVDARRRDRGNDVLAHQRYTDRDKVEETLELMRDESSVSTDILSMQSADVLRRLLDIEDTAARGSTFTANLTPSTVSTPYTQEDGMDEETSSVFQLKIPYYGTVTISPDAPPSRQPFRPTGHELEQGLVGGDEATRMEPGGGSTVVDTAGLGFSSRPDRNLAPNPAVGGIWTVGNDRFDTLGPGFSAGVEDWAFQGVDAAFFDSMIRGFEGPESTD